MPVSQAKSQHNPVHQLIQQSKSQSLHFNQKKKEKKKLVVALKTEVMNEQLDHWLTLYDRPLFPLRENEILFAHFASKNLLIYIFLQKLPCRRKKKSLRRILNILR